MSTSRNNSTRMETAPRKTAGQYYVDVSHTARANESALNELFGQRLDTHAQRYGGTRTASSLTYPDTGISLYQYSYRFQNRQQAIAFCQYSGVPHETNSVVFVADAAAIVALP